MYSCWAGWPLPATSLVSVHVRIDGLAWPASATRSARSRAAAICAGVSARQRPPGSHGPTSCQTRMPAASRRASMLSDSGSWERVALAPTASQAVDDRVLVGAGQRVAVAARVGRQRGAAQRAAARR